LGGRRLDDWLAVGGVCCRGGVVGADCDGGCRGAGNDEQLGPPARVR
jgi:hypothetical protein